MDRTPTTPSTFWTVFTVAETTWGDLNGKTTRKVRYHETYDDWEEVLEAVDNERGQVLSVIETKEGGGKWEARDVHAQAEDENHARYMANRTPEEERRDRQLASHEFFKGE